MQIEEPTALLAGMSPAQFMRRRWHRKPLLVRQALPGLEAPVTRQSLFALAAREEVECRLLQRDDRGGWRLRHGPFGARSLPSRAKAGWTLLVQGVDLHFEAARALLERFRFLPDARLDDLMVSYASDGGGVGPHVDSYDVFLLQLQGRRRWSWGRPQDLGLVPGLPLKILSRFEPEATEVLGPGDMLYLPPLYAHDGVAEGPDCMTASIGLRSPAAAPLGAELLSRLGEAMADAHEGEPPAARGLYRDPAQPALAEPARMPPALVDFARRAVAAALRDADAVPRALGELLTEPKPQVFFDAEEPPAELRGVRLDRRTRMLYDERHLFINGESIRASGRDASLMRRLADERRLAPAQLRGASADAVALLRDWCEAGWCHATAPDEAPGRGAA